MKRGISPLLSFILILLFIMAIFAFLFPWFTAFTRQLGKQGEETGNRPLYCDGISLSINNWTRNRDSLYANLTIENKGRFEIERFTITRETSYQSIASCLLLNTNLEPNNNKEISIPIIACGPIPVTPPTCSDNDGDGYWVGDCDPDCDDNDINVHEEISCTVFNGLQCNNQMFCALLCPNNALECNPDIEGGNGLDEDCDGVPDDGCLIWQSSNLQFEDSINDYNYPPTCGDTNNPICVPECDCGSQGGYGGSFPRCGWLLNTNYCSRYSPSITDFGSCKEEFIGSPYVPGQCVFLKNANDPNLIGKDRWFSFNLPISISNPSIDLDLLECDVKVRVEGANDQNREDLFIMVNSQSIIYLDDLNNPVDTWEERIIGRFDRGRVRKGQNTIRFGNPADPPEDAPFGLISSTHGDWFKFYCYNPIVNL